MLAARTILLLRELFTIDVRSLALFRIGVGGVLLLNLLQRAADLAAMYTDEGMLPIDLNWQLRETTLAWSVHALDGSVEFVANLFVIHALLAVCIVIGWQTRWSCVFAWLLLVSLHHRNPLLVTGGDVLLGVFLFWGCLLPLDARWSISARRGKSLHVEQQCFSLATIGLMLQIFCMYAATGWSKMNEVWWSGDALQRVMHYDMLVRPLGVYLRDFPAVLRILTFTTFALELVGPWLLLTTWWKHRLRLFGIAAFVGLHLGIELTMNVMIFSWVSLAGLAVFLPTRFWESSWLKRGQSHGTTEHAELPLGREPSDKKRSFGVSFVLASHSVVCGFAIAFILIYNAASTIHGPLPAKWWLERAGSLLTWNQRWTMFNEPEPINARHIMLAQLSNGRIVDVLRDGRAIDSTALKEPAKIPAKLPTQRWMQLCMYLNFDANARYRRHAAKYRLRSWNATHSNEEQIELLDYLMANAVDGTIIRLAQVDPFAEGEFVDDQPDGLWTYRHRNGQVSARGRFVDGKKQGVWKTFYSDGRPESEGLFREDQQHGLWRYWNEDGTEFTTRYEHGQPITADVSRSSAEPRAPEIPETATDAPNP